jgi:3-deoxy-7-phosphoheptulonate synthase
MIVILKPTLTPNTKAYQETLATLSNLPNVTIQVHTTEGTKQSVTQVHLLGESLHWSMESIEALPGVARVVRISPCTQQLLKSSAQEAGFEFQYQGLTFSQQHFHIFAGLCAVESKASAKAMMHALQQQGLCCTRMGVYKPRTSPYAFQGLGKLCLPYLFELAGEYGIKVIAMEVTHERQLLEIQEIMERLNHPTGVMLQVGTRNAQNFELLRALGEQKTFPILYKRGFGITLEESLNAAEYLINAGNPNVIFCLRGIKSLAAAPHRNLVDFTHVGAIKRMTKMPVCIDPSHSVGSLEAGGDHLNDIFHASAQGVIAGANMLLVDFHPTPTQAAVDARQAIHIDQLNWYLEDVALARATYLKRVALASTYAAQIG